MPVAKCVRPSCQRTCDTQSGWCAACQPKVLKLAALRAADFDELDVIETEAPIVDPDGRVDAVDAADAGDGTDDAPCPPACPYQSPSPAWQFASRVQFLVNRLHALVQSEDWTQWSRDSFVPVLFAVVNMLETIRYDVSARIE